LREARGDDAVSEAAADQQQLYRHFRFRETPRIFTLKGDLRQYEALEPVQYRASIA
jgi:hypothetical protein